MFSQKVKDVTIGKISKSAYGCFVQQAMTLCKLYCNEYWKLFIQSHLEFDYQNKYDHMDDYIISKDIVNVIDSMKNYYGIEFDNTDTIDFNANKLYLVSFDLYKYPLAKNIDRETGYEDTHCFIVYGEDENNYIIKDEFYDLCDYKISKEIFWDGVKNIFIVKTENKSPLDQNASMKLVIKNLQEKDANVIKEWLRVCSEHKIHDYNYNALFYKFRSIFSRVEHLSIIVKEISESNPYLLKLSEVLHDIFDELKSIWYKVMKHYLEYQKIDRAFFIDNLLYIKELYEDVDFTLKEVVNVLDHNPECIKLKLEKTLNEYLDRKVKLNELILKEHDGITILRLFSVFEKEYNIELNTVYYRGIKTYGDFIMITYGLVMYNIKKHQEHKAKSISIYT